MSEKDLKDANSEIETKSFDDAELEDIMNEIEELEKDFAADDSADDISEALGIEDNGDVTAEDLSVEKESVQSTQLQDVIDQEVEEILDDAIASQDGPEPVVAQEPVQEEPTPGPVAEAEPEPVAEVIEEPIAEVIEESVLEEEEPVVMESEPLMEEESIEASEAAAHEEMISARDEALEAIESKIVAFESSEEKMSQEEEVAMDAETRMDFAVSGQMKLKLNFEVAGQKVHLSVDEENGFIIEMDGGARFSVPMEQKKAS